MQFGAVTSNVPFAAIVVGKNQLGPAVVEIGFWRPLVAIVVYAVAYSFASGTIVSAGTSSPSIPGTQPVSLNISLASFRSVIHSLGIALLMVRR